MTQVVPAPLDNNLGYVGEIAIEEQIVEQSTPEFQKDEEQVTRKRLQLEWIDSEWFQVWLKLARGEYKE